MNPRGVFVTGTDTEVGKTWVATGLLSALRRRGLRVAAAKPVECGGRDDARALLAATGRDDLPLDAVNPRHFEAPLAPAAAAGGRFDLDGVLSSLGALAGGGEFLVVEGAGGWLVPLDAERTMADLATGFGLPVVLVAANRLGCLNHALLTARAVRDAGLPLAAVYLNTLPSQPASGEVGVRDLSRASNGRVLAPHLGDCPLFEDDLEALAEHLLS